MNNKRLLLILLLLLVGYAVIRLTKVRPQRSFRSEIVQVDTAAVDRILIERKAEGMTVELLRDGDSWQVADGDTNYPADRDMVRAVLNTLPEIRAERVVAKKAERYADYEVGEGQGTRVSVYEDDRMQADFILGRFSFDQMSRSATSYVKPADDENVYAVDGFLSMTYDRSAGNWRDKTLMPQDLSGVHSIEKQDRTGRAISAGWNGMEWRNEEGIVLDSAWISTYLTGLAGLKGTNVHSGAGEGLEMDAVMTYQVAGSPEPLTLTAYRAPGDETEFLIGSSLNPGSLFQSDSSGIWTRIFQTPF